MLHHHHHHHNHHYLHYTQPSQQGTTTIATTHHNLCTISNRYHTGNNHRHNKQVSLIIPPSPLQYESHPPLSLPPQYLLPHHKPPHLYHYYHGTTIKTMSDSHRGSAGSRNRTFLWCTPRSCSTVLTKCLSGVEALQVWFEPYCFCNWAHAEWERRYGRPLPAEYEGNEVAYRELAAMYSSCRPGRYNPESLS